MVPQWQIIERVLKMHLKNHLFNIYHFYLLRDLEADRERDRRGGGLRSFDSDRPLLADLARLPLRLRDRLRDDERDLERLLRDRERDRENDLK